MRVFNWLSNVLRSLRIRHFFNFHLLLSRRPKYNGLRFRHVIVFIGLAPFFFTNLNAQSNIDFVAEQVTVGGDTNLVVATGDLNGDGIPDIAVRSTTADGDSSTVVLLGTGDGSFSTASIVGDSLGGQLEAVDLDGDGDVDLVGDLGVLLGNGDGTFVQGQELTGATFGYGFLTVADFNGDGAPDLAFPNLYSDDATVFMGNGDGTFGEVQLVPTLGPPCAVGSGDFNGDGFSDLVALVYGPSRVVITLGQADGSFQSPTVVTSNVSGYDLATGDFNGDGNMDIAAFGDVFFGDGNGEFNGSVPLPFFIVNCVETGDFDGDGFFDDIADTSFAFDIRIAVFTGSDIVLEGPFASSDQLFPYCHTSTADFNGDGISDLVTADSADFIHVFVSQSDDKTILGDVNRDGVVDQDDISPFVDAIIAGIFDPKADTNGDGAVNLLDILTFINLLSG